MAEQVTYEGLQQDDDFIADAYWFLKDVGESVSTKPKDILDTFIEKRRAFDVNVFSTYSQGSDIKKAQDETKKYYRRAVEKLDQMPDFYESGGAPAGKAILDYGYYSLLDPTNLLSVLAGAATLPAGGAGAYGVLGAKEVAKQGVSQMLKAKLKASVSKPVLKALALEGTIAGSGGVTQATLSQETDMDIGRRKEGDYDYSAIALQGLLEGTLSPVAGVALNMAGATIGKGANAAVSSTEYGRWGKEWLKRNFLPPASQDRQAQRFMELNDERYTNVYDRTQQNAQVILGAEANFAKEVDELTARNITNDIIEGKSEDALRAVADAEDALRLARMEEARFGTNSQAIPVLEEGLKELKAKNSLYLKFKEINPDVEHTMETFRNDVKFLQQDIGDTPYLSNQFKEIFEGNDSYLRDVHEKFYTLREDFDKFMARPENSNIFADYKKLVTDSYNTVGKELVQDDSMLIKLRVLDQVNPRDINNKRNYNKDYLKNGKLDEGKLDERIRLEIKKEYDPKLDQQAKFGITYRKKNIDPVLDQIWGRNFSPALRMAETVGDMINTIKDVRMAGTLKQNLQARSTAENPLIVSANSAEGARLLANGEEMVPLNGEVKKIVDPREPSPEPVFDNYGNRLDVDVIEDPDALFNIPGRYVTEELGGDIQLPQRSEFVPEQIAKDLGLDSGVVEPANLGVNLEGSRGIKRYVYETDANKRFVLDQNNQKIIKRDNEGNPVSYLVDNITGKVLPTDINTQRYYIRKDFAKRYKEMLSNEDILGNSVDGGQKFLRFGLNFFSQMQGYLKKGKTVYNPVAEVRNALGAGGYMINSGNISGFYHLAKFYTTASKEEQKMLVEMAQRLGLKGSQIELNQILNRVGKKQVGLKVTGKELAHRIASGQVLGALDNTKLDKFLVKLYSMTDDIGKLGTWFGETMTQKRIWNEMGEADKMALRNEYVNNSFAKEFFNSKQMENIRILLDNKARNIELSPSQNKLLKEFDDNLNYEIAAGKTLDLVPIYSRIPKIIEKMRGVPVVGNFAAFPAENLRNKFYLFKTAGAEIREGFEKGNTAMVKAGAKRILAQSGYAAAPAAMAYTYNQIEGTSEAADAIREGLMPWQKDHAIAVRKGKNGKYFYSDLSYSNTDAAVLDIITPYLASAARGEDPTEAITEIFPRAVWNYLSSFMEPSLASDVAGYFYDYAKAPTDEERAKLLTKIAKTMVPGALKSTAEVAADVGAFSHSTFTANIERAFRPLYYGEQRKRFKDSADLSSFLARHNVNTKYGPALATFGIASGEKEWDPIKTFAYVSRNLQRNVLKDITDTKREVLAKVGDPSLPYDSKDMLKEYNELFEEQFVAQQGIAKLIRLYSRVLPQKQLQAIIRSKPIRGSLSLKQISNINKDKFMPEELSQDFIKKLRLAYADGHYFGSEFQRPFQDVVKDLRSLHNMWKYADLNKEELTE